LQALNTIMPLGRILGEFAEFERTTLRDRVVARAGSNAVGPTCSHTFCVAALIWKQPVEDLVGATATPYR
jgi:hypothetical protein